MKWLSVDESMPTVGIAEGVFKIFVSGGDICLRENHEAETHFADWPRCGKTWSMNPDDVPYVPSAMESAYRRRLRCVVMRSKFTQNPGEVCADSRIFLSDDTLKHWMRGPEATNVFCATVLMPFIRKTSKIECEMRLRRSPASVVEDSAWLLRKMARIGPPDVPTGFHDGPTSDAIDPPVDNATLHEIVVRETHIAALSVDASARDIWSATVAKLPRAPSNTGVKFRKNVNDTRRTKTDILDAAIAHFPHLIKKVDGSSRLEKKTYKYRFRQLHIERFESILRSVSADSGKSASDVFGAWSDWGDHWAVEKEKRYAGDMPPRVRENWSDSVLIVSEAVDIVNLMRYSLEGKDRRQGQLAEFTKLHERFGDISRAGGSRVDQKYARKSICGVETGRLYAQNVSLQTLTKEAREAACAAGRLDIDITNCFPNCVTPLYPDRDLGAVQKYVGNTHLWRRAVSEYYNISADPAKELLMCALYGFPTPRNSISESPHVLPFAEWLSEDVGALRQEICRDNPDVLEHFAINNRPNAEATTFFYAVTKKEDEIMDPFSEQRLALLLHISSDPGNCW